MSEFQFGDAQHSEEGRVHFDVHVPTDLKHLEGHFPGNPLVPGVAQVVALAETGARRAFPELGFAIGLRRVKFTHALRPGDDLRLALSRDGGKVRFEVRKGETLCSRGALVFE